MTEIKTIARQTSIVAMLDKFDTLTHSISECLSREIELRQNQYEHYRNLLLQFLDESTTESTKDTKMKTLEPFVPFVPFVVK